jgi:hypothetical protein
MTQEELQVWFKGSVEYYNTNCEEGFEMAYEYRSYVEWLKQQLSQKKETYVQGVEYISTIQTIQLMTQFMWNERPMNSYLITLEGVNGNFTLNLPTNMAAGQNLVLIITQDATGSRVMTSNAGYKFVNAVKTLSTAATAIDILSIFYLLLAGAIKLTYFSHLNHSIL